MKKTNVFIILGLLLVGATIGVFSTQPAIVQELEENELVEAKSDEALVFVIDYGFVGENNDREKFPSDNVVGISTDNKKEMVSDFWGRLYIRDR